MPTLADLGAPTESSTQTAIMQILQYYQNMGKLYYLRNNTGAYASSYKNKMGEDKTRFIHFGRFGAADLLVFFKRGHTEFWEIKSIKGSLSKGQFEFKEFMGNLGYIYRVFRSADEAEKVIAEQLKISGC